MEKKAAREKKVVGREGVPGLGGEVGERSATGGFLLDAGDGGEGEIGRAELSGGDVEAESVVQVGRSVVVECFVCVGEELEGDYLVDGEPVQVSQVGGDVAVAGYVEDKSGGGVLDALEALQVLGRDACVEYVAVVELAADEGLCYCFSCFSWDPFVDPAKHAEGVVAGGGDGIDLF
ncbi:hypothetical protein NDU88_008038 [Pleurodeles waltl]|uniref:Uncharacterized protein n=1 Tax=Pleurodeles waltl TaxID=8319 RepID=A0AAV7VVH6_PLEWA|nr:hypothetical protein NDU88_008038 [Pleurodeles waltl]